jgi:hypothetical protein
LNILLLYHASQTYTNTVFEHVDAFRRFSRHTYTYCHQDEYSRFRVDLSRFDAVIIHYCLRLPYNQISRSTAQALARFEGTKVLFIQDEYDYTRRTWEWIHRLGLHLVFTVVPEPHIARVYPPEEFPGVRFVSNLTGYVPQELESAGQARPLAERKVAVGYRARELPLRYGQLGFEKVEIGKLVKAYCDSHAIPQDIAWTESSRIYGPAWYEFMSSCRAMLGSESGSNVFDWDGTLAAQVDRYRSEHPWADNQEIYRAVIAQREMPGLMNQISPRVFECVASRTALILFEGSYSGVVEPWRHYLPLKKDGSNLDAVFDRLRDDAFVAAMTERAWDDLIVSKRHGYPAFIAMVDAELDRQEELRPARPMTASATAQVATTRFWGGVVLSQAPLRKAPPSGGLLARAWRVFPEPLKVLLRPAMRAARERLRRLFGAAA